MKRVKVTIEVDVYHRPTSGEGYDLLREAVYWQMFGYEYGFLVCEVPRITRRANITEAVRHQVRLHAQRPRKL